MALAHSVISLKLLAVDHANQLPVNSRTIAGQLYPLYKIIKAPVIWVKATKSVMASTRRTYSSIFEKIEGYYPEKFKKKEKKEKFKC